MYVLIEKWSDGVRFALCSKTGKVVDRTLSDKGSRALSVAGAWYQDAVMRAFAREGLGEIGYAQQFARAAITARAQDYFMRLEPAGFAIRAEDGSWTMNDTGSTPTPVRARVLACYQAPLREVTASLHKEYGSVRKVTRHQRVVPVEFVSQWSEYMQRNREVAKVRRCNGCGEPDDHKVCEPAERTP